MKSNLSKDQESARQKICLPLDGMDSIEEIMARVKELGPFVGMFKVGKASYTAHGPELIRKIHALGYKVFLDLKYHDIPQTVYEAVKQAALLGVYMINIHASGGREMMLAAVRGLEDGLKSASSLIDKPILTAVTILTSLDELRYIQGILPVFSCLSVGGSTSANIVSLSAFPFDEAIDAQIAMAKEKDKGKKAGLKEEYEAQYGNQFSSLLTALGLDGIIQKLVINYAQMANNAGLDGIVCSAADLDAINNLGSQDALPGGFVFVTPGIKSPNTKAGTDQQRVLTAGVAIKLGSSKLVVGRAITGPDTSEGRQAAALDVINDIVAAK